MAKCYMCNEVATSREHAPPDCFFPAGMKKNLSTVRCCAAHNEETSSEDEYCSNWFTTSIQNNQTGLDHFLDKGACSLQFKKAEEGAPAVVIAPGLAEVWPKELPAKATALSTIQQSLTATVDVDTIAACFEGKKSKKRLEEIARLLETLEALGRARKVDGGWVGV